MQRRSVASGGGKDTTPKTCTPKRAHTRKHTTRDVYCYHTSNTKEPLPRELGKEILRSENDESTHFRNVRYEKQGRRARRRERRASVPLSARRERLVLRQAAPDERLPLPPEVRLSSENDVHGAGGCQKVWEQWKGY